ncbi:MAG: pyridoxal-dependent decarboxylase, exosortase A system-associated [Rhodocyclaceae bacterium]|nr:pyridoxal-dependent decarboxylase, exosortase A system-associated [Rhodocyclaceae bacterium]
MPFATAPRHAPPLFAMGGDGALLLGGEPVTTLGAQHGTPLYVIDSTLVRARIAEVRALLPAGVRLHYAIKANPLPELLRLLASLVDGFDIASAGELALARAAGHHGADLGFAGPGKRDAELAAAVDAGAIINVESAGELARLAALAPGTGQRALAALRVNPDFELRQAGMRMGGGAQVFGIDAEDVPGVLAAWPAGVEFAGFHIYAGSQNLDGEQIAGALRRSHALCARLAAHAPDAPRVFNLGGGFGIPYFANDARLDTAPIRAALADIAREHAAHFAHTHLVLELGRYLVGEAGVFLTRVIDRKRSRGREFLVCDGGMHQHLAASGNFGQVIRRDYPLWLARDMGAPRDTAFTVCGPLCTPLDVLAREALLPADVRPGDILAIGQSGAYGASASPAGFLSHPPAGQLLV